MICFQKGEWSEMEGIKRAGRGREGEKFRAEREETDLERLQSVAPFLMLIDEKLAEWLDRHLSSQEGAVLFEVALLTEPLHQLTPLALVRVLGARLVPHICITIEATVRTLIFMRSHNRGSERQPGPAASAGLRSWNTLLNSQRPPGGPALTAERIHF
jgi:hypothetical protein